MTQILVLDERVEYRDGMGDCFCCEIAVVTDDGQVLEEQGVCEPLALENVDEAYCARRIKELMKPLRERWKKSLDESRQANFDLAAVQEASGGPSQSS